MHDDIMAPVQPKTKKALAAAFISNCQAQNFRLVEALMEADVKIDSYCGCHRNRNGSVKKVEALMHYKFSLAFENTNEEDYITEKFFQSLVAGSVPVDGNMKALLVDMAAVHSSCRLCIFVVTRIREQEDKTPEFKRRPCKCTRGSETVYHLYVRERGRFDMEFIFLKNGNLTLEALESAVLTKFKSLRHEPIWKKERPASLRGDGELRVHMIYPLGLTQRQALYNFKFEGNSSLSTHIKKNPCAKFEVVFV